MDVMRQGERSLRKNLPYDAKRNKSSASGGEIYSREPFLGKRGPVYDTDTKAWQNCIREYQEEVRIIAEEFEAVFVPLQECFDRACEKQDTSYWIWDGGTSYGKRTRTDCRAVAEEGRGACTGWGRFTI